MLPIHSNVHACRKDYIFNSTHDSTLLYVLKTVDSLELLLMSNDGRIATEFKLIAACRQSSVMVNLCLTALIHRQLTTCSLTSTWWRFSPPA